MRKAVIYILNIMFVFLLVGCGKKVSQTEEPETAIENILQEEAEEEKIEDDNVEENSIDILQEISKDYGEKPFEPENRYYISEDQYVVNDGAEYGNGNIKQEHEAFSDQNGRNFFYYDMECFYFDETYPAILNETLQTYYDGKKETYHHDAETYDDESYRDIPSGNLPFDSLLFRCVTYAGDDYASLLFNDVNYAGGAHPYSVLDGITIDCGTGEIVSVNRFIDDSDEEIREQINAVLDKEIYDPKDWDYYITDETVVFFYYDPRFWESVVTKRTR